MKYKYSFTLIELMVVIGIVVVLTAASVAGISASRNRKQVKGTAEKLKSFLTEARSLAVNPQDTSFGVTKIRVEIDSPTAPTETTIKLYDVVGSSPTERTAPKFKIPNGVRIETDAVAISNMKTSAIIPSCPAASCKYFSFSTVPTTGIGKIVETNTPTDADINIKLTDGSQTYTLTMNVLTGMITVTE